MSDVQSKRELVVIEFLTVDGVMQGLGSPDEDRDGGFDLGGWGAPYAESFHADVADEGLGDTSAYLFGRRTYEKMAAFWPHQPDSNPIAAHMNDTPKYVASTTLAAATWPGTTVISSDLGPAVTQLKAKGTGRIAVLGSGVMVSDLLRHGLVDEMRLIVHPLLLGQGKRLFPRLDRPRSLELVDHAVTRAGSLALRYRLDT